VALLVPLRLRLTLKGRGQYGDTWVLAGGLECLKFTVTVAAAHATDSLLQIHFFNWRVLMRRSSPKRAPSGEDRRLDEAVGKLVGWEKDLGKRFDRRELWRFVLGLRRHARLKSFQGHFRYCTPNVAFTGMSSGALYAIAGLVAHVGQFVVVPEWDDEARADGDIDLVVKLWPVRAAVSTAWFVMKNIRMREPIEPGAGAEAQAVPAQS
jgi:hypothetical protein